MLAAALLSLGRESRKDSVIELAAHRLSSSLCVFRDVPYRAVGVPSRRARTIRNDPRIAVRDFLMKLINQPAMKLKSTLLGIACAIVASVAFAQTEITTTTTTVTTSTGTISEYSPGSAFIIKETSGPVSYRYGETITYVTRSGKTLTDDEVRTRVKVGTPVNVHFVTEGDDRILNRVEIDDEEIEIDDD